MVSLREGLLNSKNIKNTKNKISFKKNDLVLGSVVMFRDETFGMYVPKENYNLVKHLEGAEKPTDYFVSYDSDSEDDAPALALDIKDFNDDLIFSSNDYDIFDIERVYFDTVPYNRLNKGFFDDFIRNINSFIKDKKYIER